MDHYLKPLKSAEELEPVLLQGTQPGLLTSPVLRSPPEVYPEQNQIGTTGFQWSPPIQTTLALEKILAAFSRPLSLGQVFRIVLYRSHPVSPCQDSSWSMVLSSLDR